MNLINAYNMLRFFKKCDIKDETVSLYYTQLFADDYKFLESLDYTLQLIDIYEKDKKIVIDELENVIRGKSLNDVSSDLNIDTSKCKRLLKEYKGDQR